ncbi:MAG: hypothetical protein MUO26_10995, partial [Methanotrichaceae archaeon]|nr:hypothetical protein [Methanotrichaceae archaeon]
MMGVLGAEKARTEIGFQSQNDRDARHLNHWQRTYEFGFQQFFQQLAQRHFSILNRGYPVNNCNFGIACPEGQVCRNGRCVAVDPCAGVTCPEGQVCQAGRCVAEDLCADVTCEPGQVCQAGRCVAEDLCADVTCEPGQVCQAGECVAE